MRVTRVLCSMAVALSVASAAAAQAAQTADTAPRDRHTQVDALFAPWSGTTTPGCVVAISQHGAIEYARGYGMANLEYDIAITPDSIFHVASISKQFTAFAIGLLAQDGRLSLDDDVRKYLPELPDFGHKVTIAQMVHHTAGLREEFHLMYLAGWRYEDPRTEADALRMSSMQHSLNFTPGSEPLYSNSHYTPLAIIVQRVSGKPLRVFAAERIFRPLGMLDTHFQDRHTEVVRRRATGYGALAGGGWRTFVPRSDNYGASNLLTTVGDLMKWEQNLIDARVGGRALVDWMQTSGTLNNGEAIGYGGGLRIGAYRGLRTVSHDGADAGYRADVVSFPDQRLVIAALCNASTIAPGALTRKVADVYLGDQLKPLPSAVKVAESELSALAGIYWNALSDEVIQLEVKDGTLRPVGSPDPLVPIGNGVFHVHASTGLIHEWSFSTPAASAPAHAAATATAHASAARELRIVDAWPQARTFTRLTTPTPSAAALAAYAGQYRSDETAMTYAVRVENGKLAVRWARDTALTLDAVGGDHFYDGVYTVSFTRSAAGEIDGLTISTRRVRRLRANRIVSPSQSAEYHPACPTLAAHPTPACATSSSSRIGSPSR